MSLSWKENKYTLNSSNKQLLIGIIVILFIFWFLYYLLPNLLILLLNTFLGNLLILLTILLISSKNLRFGIIIGIIALSLIRMSSMISSKEGFTWNEKDKNNFISLQQTKNPGIVFDTSIIEKQISNEELEYYFNNGKWPWSKKTEELYTEALNNNPIIRQYPKLSMENSKTIYNENAILQILGQQTKEGQFLINGVELELKDYGKSSFESDDGLGKFPYNSGQKIKRRPIIKCDMYNSNQLVKITPTGRDPVLGSETSITNLVNINNLEDLIPGFKFLKGKCNPCTNINGVPEYNCPFELKIKNNEGPISSVWEYLWFNK